MSCLPEHLQRPRFAPHAILLAIRDGDSDAFQAALRAEDLPCVMHADARGRSREAHLAETSRKAMQRLAVEPVRSGSAPENAR